MVLIDAEVDCLLRSSATALAPYLSDLLVIGACANSLYRYHPLASRVSIAAASTKDVDIACGTEIPSQGRPLILDLLRLENLEPRLFGTHTPPVMKFSPHGSRSNVELEFLCPLIGKPNPKREFSQQAIDVQAGITAQPLRYLNLLFIEPWEIEWSRIPGCADLAALQPVRVPNPVTYVIQKVLAMSRQGRTSPERAKDCYYLYEVSALFRDAFPQLSSIVQKLRRQIQAKWLTRFVHDIDWLFQNPSSLGPVEAARVARELQKQGVSIDSQMVYQAMSNLIRGLGLRA